MSESTPIAGRPLHTALMHLITAKRDEVERCCEDFVTVDDPESLHDLRVALRRLHSLFIGFSPCIQAGSPLPESLRTLFKTTNRARDLEVTLALLARHSLALPWLQQQWHDELTDEYRRLRETLPAEWRALSPQLDTPADLLVVVKPETTLGGFAATALHTQAKILLKRTRRVARQWNERQAHKLRIRAKRVRYVLEPLVEENPAVAQAVDRLKRFQDSFGEYHDLVVLIGRLKRQRHHAAAEHEKALEAAIEQLKQERRAQRRKLRHNYRGKPWKRLGKALRSARHELAPK